MNKKGKIDEVLGIITECIVRLNSVSDALFSIKLKVEGISLECEIEESDARTEQSRK